MKAAVTLALALLVGCSREAPARPPAERSAEMQVASIPPTPVTGSLEGQRFTLRDAWYRVVRKAGRERLDLILSEGRVTRLCAESDPERSRHVFLRFPSWQRPVAGEYRVDPGAAGAVFSAHYEAPDERQWRGTLVASAVVVFDAPEGDTVDGRVEVCFGDATQSCVKGSFRARECRSELDPDGPRSGNLHHPDADAGASHEHHAEHGAAP